MKLTQKERKERIIKERDELRRKIEKLKNDDINFYGQLHTITYGIESDEYITMNEYYTTIDRLDGFAHALIALLYAQKHEEETK